MQSRKLELLSPAKNIEVGKAAIVAGADAVYIGGPAFGARSSAGNSIDDLRELCKFAHRFGAKVYMTLNTLLYDEEVEGARALLKEARDAGIDAIIMQDPALLTMEELQGMEAHASTQCNINTLDKVDFCVSHNMSQIVLPREFDLETIRYFCEKRPDVRFEVFVSGALCVSVSGVCFISELMTDRSANRGSCAQICRLPMEFYHQDPKNKEAEPELKASGHLLSMKDNLRLDRLEDIVEAGASSFKIEGRLKDKDFVVNQVSAFREKLDEIIAKSNGKYERASIGYLNRNFKPNLNKTFNRGFTDAWLLGDNAKMINTKTPKSLGEIMGTVVSLSEGKAKFDGGRDRQERTRFNDRGSRNAGRNGGHSHLNDRIHGNASANANANVNGRSFKVDVVGAYIDLKLSKDHELSNGDSFTYFDANGELTGFRVNRVELIEKARNSKNGPSKNGAAKNSATVNAKGGANGGSASSADLVLNANDVVRLHLLKPITDIKIGDTLYRNVDTFFIKTISMPKVISRKVDLKAEVSVADGKISVLFFDEYGRQGSASVELNAVDSTDEVKALSESAMLSKLPKLGDDYLVLSEENVSFKGEIDKAYLTISAFNELRRVALKNYLSVVELTFAQSLEAKIPYMDESLKTTQFTLPQPDKVVKFPDRFIDPRLILNETTKAFYQSEMGDLVPPPRLTANAVMTCRNCLVKNHAICHEDGGSTRGFYLQIGKHRFDVVTNCRDCLMYLVPYESNPAPPSAKPI